MEKKIFVLELSKLEKGDIILQRFPNEASRGIREKTGSEYSHAMLYMGNSSILHANLKGGVAAINAQREGVENADDMVVLRLKEGVSCDMHQLIQYARRTVGTAYSLKEAIQVTSDKVSGYEIDGATTNRQFCTKYVAMAYDAGGVKIVNDPTACTPQEILTSDKLERVEGAVRQATPAERKLVEEGSETLNNQTDMTEELLRAVREETKQDIQTFEQLLDASLESPELDEMIYQICKDHPYMSMLDRYHEIRPEEYDYEMFIEKYRESSWDVAWKMASDMQEQNERYCIQYILLQQEYKKKKTKTCALFVDLHKRLVHDCAERNALFLVILKGVKRS